MSINAKDIIKVEKNNKELTIIIYYKNHSEKKLIFVDKTKMDKLFQTMMGISGEN